MKSAFCSVPAANAASIRAERGDSPAAIAQNRPSAALQLQTRQTFRPKGAFFRPRLHGIGLLRHSSCKRGKHSGHKERLPSRDCTKSAFCGTPNANAAAFRRKGAFFRPRLHRIGLLRHSSCKRGKLSHQRIQREPSRQGVRRGAGCTIGGAQCSKQSHRSTQHAAASVRAERGVSPAAIARNQRSAALQMQTRQAFLPQGAFFRPRLHKIGVLRHSSCKRGRQNRAHSVSSRGRAYGEGRAYDKGRTMQQAVAPEHTARRGKCSGQKWCSPAAIARNRPSAAFQMQTRQAFGPKGAFFRPRLHKNGVLQRFSCKRGKCSGRKGHSPSRDCIKSAFCGIPAANAASIRAERGISLAAIA